MVSFFSETQITLRIAALTKPSARRAGAFTASGNALPVLVIFTFFFPLHFPFFAYSYGQTTPRALSALRRSFYPRLSGSGGAPHSSAYQESSQRSADFGKRSRSPGSRAGCVPPKAA